VEDYADCHLVFMAIKPDTTAAASQPIITLPLDMYASPRLPRQAATLVWEMVRGKVSREPVAPNDDALWWWPLFGDSAPDR
jgi:hypothetical protein